MGKSKKLELPAPPTYQTDPIFKSGYENLSKYGNQLITGDYTGLGGIADTVSLHPQNTQLALAAAQGFLQPQYDQSVRDLRNEAAANNQLSSSTFTDALARNAQTLNSQYQGIASQAALTDSQNAMQNRIGLLGTGLNTLNSATAFGQGNQNSQNQFNLSNYENQVAAMLAGQKQSNGGLMGGLLGGGGGALGGLGVAALMGLGGPMTALAVGGGALLGGAAGAFTPQSSNVGGNLFSSGAGLVGSGLQNQQFNNLSAFKNTGSGTSIPGLYASNFANNNMDIGSKLGSGYLQPNEFSFNSSLLRGF